MSSQMFVIDGRFVLLIFFTVNLPALQLHAATQTSALRVGLSSSVKDDKLLVPQPNLFTGPLVLTGAILVDVGLEVKTERY